MGRLRRWVARVLGRLLTPVWARLVGPGDILLHAQVIARREGGQVVYQLLDGAGRPADGATFSGLIQAIADIGGSADVMDPGVRRECRRLADRLHQLRRLAVVAGGVQ